MTNLAIIGPGLLGGSLALAARELGGFRVSLWARRAEAVDELKSLQIADIASSDLGEVAQRADLVILCVPVGAMPAIARALLPGLPPSAVVTDVGSVKAKVVSQLESVLHPRVRYVGSHPMAGSEQTGVKAARADLFQGAACMVTPTASSDPAAVALVQQWWERLGCRVRQISPGKHDEVVAAISHLPHLVAAALVNAVRETSPDAFELAGPGFRDTSRVASGPPDMWAEILFDNRDAVRKTADAMVAKLEQFITLLGRDGPGRETSMQEFLTQAKVTRDSITLRDSRLTN